MYTLNSCMGLWSPWDKSARSTGFLAVVMQLGTSTDRGCVEERGMFGDETRT